MALMPDNVRTNHQPRVFVSTAIQKFPDDVMVAMHHANTTVKRSRGTLLFITGHSTAHFEALKLLSTQADLPLFMGDEYCTILNQQRIVLSDAMRSGFKQLLDEAVARDSVIRMTGHYDPDVVFNDVVTSLNLHDA